MKYFRLLFIKSLTCDLIGYNRLVNNVDAHTRRTGVQTKDQKFVFQASRAWTPGIGNYSREAI